MSLGLCVGVCDCMTVDVVDSCMHLNTTLKTENTNSTKNLQIIFTFLQQKIPHAATTV